MPTYSFQMSAGLAGSSVSVTAVGSSTVVASGTLDTNALFTASLPVGDYVAKAADGHYSYSSAGTVAASDPDQLVDLNSTFALKSEAGSPPGWNGARLISKMRAGTAVKVTVLGDSVLQGSTATTPGTDDAVSLFCTTLASRFGVAVTKDNQAQGGRTAAWETIEKWPAALTANADLYILGITGKNDINWEVYGSAQGRLTGYRTADSLAQVESWIRQLRADKPDADILVCSGNPYGAAYTSANTAQKAYSAGLQRLAAAYGCAYADGWNKTPRAAGSPDAADAAYLSDGVHPNSAGHLVIATAMLDNYPASFDITKAPPSSILGATPPGPAVNPLRRSRLGIVTVASASTTALNDRLVNPSLTGTWTAGATGPWTTTTANATAEFQAKCTDVFVRFTYGAGQGVVDLIVDGQPWQAGVNLTDSSLSAGKWLAISGLTPGVHNVSIKAISGSVTLEAVAYTSSACQWVDIRDAKVTATNLGAASDLNQYYGTHSNAITATTSVTFDFIGTGLTMQMGRATTGGGFYFPANGLVVDGVTQTRPVVPTPFAGYGSMDLVTGLPYGKHTATLTANATGLYIGGFSVLDERPQDHPNACEGVNKVGETVRFPFPWTDTPTVTVTSTTANAAGASTVTASSFLVTGTAGDLVKWRATSQQRGVY